MLLHAINPFIAVCKAQTNEYKHGRTIKDEISVVFGNHKQMSSDELFDTSNENADEPPFTSVCHEKTSLSSKQWIIVETFNIRFCSVCVCMLIFEV